MTDKQARCFTRIQHLYILLEYISIYYQEHHKSSSIIAMREASKQSDIQTTDKSKRNTEIYAKKQKGRQTENRQTESDRLTDRKTIETAEQTET